MGTSGIEQRNGTCYTEKECKQRNGVGVGAAFDVLVDDDDKEVLVFDDDDVTQRTPSIKFQHWGHVKYT